MAWMDRERAVGHAWSGESERSLPQRACNGMNETTSATAFEDGEKWQCPDQSSLVAERRGPAMGPLGAYRVHPSWLLFLELDLVLTIRCRLSSWEMMKWLQVVESA